jgi:formate dehydrogenase gamma subunit
MMSKDSLMSPMQAPAAAATAGVTAPTPGARVPPSVPAASPPAEAPSAAQVAQAAHPLVVPGEQAKLKRLSLSARLVHWAVALSTVVLVFTGFGQMPMYARYKIDLLPLLGWSSDFTIAITLHYLAAAVLILAATYHLALHGLRRDFDILPRRGDVRESYHIIKSMLGRGEEPPSHKFLAEQRLAYAFIAGSLLLIIMTGYVKVLKNLPGVDLPYGLLWTATTVHNLATFLLLFGVAGHLVAFIFKENRHLLPGMFHGKVDLEYARRRHCLWCDHLGISEKE